MLAAIALVAVAAFATPTVAAEDNPVVVVRTNMGAFEIELFADAAPLTVANFLRHVDEGFYDGIIFHKVATGTMLQTGRYDRELQPRESPHPPVVNEADNGYYHDRWTVGIDRERRIHGATTEFFINMAHNEMLNHRGERLTLYGFTVFGRIVAGKDVLREIEGLTTKARTRELSMVPIRLVWIETIERKS